MARDWSGNCSVMLTRTRLSEKTGHVTKVGAQID